MGGMGAVNIDVTLHTRARTGWPEKKQSAPAELLTEKNRIIKSVCESLSVKQNFLRQFRVQPSSKTVLERVLSRRIYIDIVEIIVDAIWTVLYHLTEF